MTDAEVIDAYRRGEPLRMIARRYGVSHETVRMLLKRLGERIRPRSFRSEWPQRSR